MILVVGGLAAGKEAYVRSLGYGEADLSSQLDAACPVIADVQELVRDEDADVEALASRIAAEKQVVLCVEVGSGIVPNGPHLAVIVEADGDFLAHDTSKLRM